MLRHFALSAVLVGLAVSQAQAQYYQEPQQGFPPPQGYPPQAPGYAPQAPGYAPQAPGYAPQAYYGPPGGQCDAFFRTPYGPRRLVCPMGRAKPVGAPCECFSTDGSGPPAHGHVIP